MARSTRLTRAGTLFLEHVRRVFAALEQARESVKAAANGFHGQLRVALSDGITPSRLPTLLALSWQEEPDVELRLFEVSLSQQIKGLHGDLYDLGPSLVKWVTTSWLRRFGAPPSWSRRRHGIRCSSTNVSHWTRCCVIRWCW
jgi:DNA-binding transcriptional LysR family regulator